MPCAFRSFEFFLILGVPAFLAVAACVASVAMANIREHGPRVALAETFGVSFKRAHSPKNMFMMHGFFREAAYGNPAAQGHMRRAKRFWEVALLFFALVFLATGLIYFGDACPAR